MGIFWQDAMANSAMFYFLVSMVMRLMAARSVTDSRRSVLSMFLIHACGRDCGGLWRLGGPGLGAFARFLRKWRPGP